MSVLEELALSAAENLAKEDDAAPARPSRDGHSFSSAERFAAAMEEAGALMQPPVELAQAAGSAAPQSGARPEPDIYVQLDGGLDEIATGAVRRNAQNAQNAQAGAGVAGSGTSDGGVILEGLQRIRGVVDRKIAELNRPPDVTDPEVLIDRQKKLAEFSLFFDVASKFVGKAAETTKTLMTS